MPRITVDLTLDEMAALRAVAQRGLRAPRDQLRSIVQRALIGPQQEDDDPVVTEGEARRRTAAALERIAAALEAANANDPLDAINRALAETAAGDDAVFPSVVRGVPDDEAWRLR